MQVQLLLMFMTIAAPDLNCRNPLFDVLASVCGRDHCPIQLVVTHDGLVYGSRQILVHFSKLARALEIARSFREENKGKLAALKAGTTMSMLFDSSDLRVNANVRQARDGLKAIGISSVLRYGT